MPVIRETDKTNLGKPTNMLCIKLCIKHVRGLSAKIRQEQDFVNIRFIAKCSPVYGVP